MYRTDEYYCYSMPELFSKYDINNIKNNISRFLCSKNLEVQKFLTNNAIEFTVKHQAVTYLIYDNSNILSAYFTLAIKPIVISVETLSKNNLNRILRISDIDNISNTVNPSAYLIAQLGKADESTININDIFEFINYYINEFQNGCGGVVEFLESESNDKLISIYQSIGFKTFNIRKSKSGEDRKLVQMYRLI